MGAGKADFNDVYTQPDPRAYYETLGALDYQIPAHGSDVFSTLLEDLRPEVEGTATVLDVCCSYGVNAALLNHDLTLEEITEHYAACSDLDRTAVLERDRSLLDERRRPDAVEIIGVDMSEPAVTYAVDAGLLRDGVVADLENHPLPEDGARKLAAVDLVTVTGGVGYVQERTFDRILTAAEDTPWVAVLSLRWVDFEPIADTLADHGLVTERLDGYVVPQRRFADRAEQQFVLEELGARQIDPAGAEATGHHCAELYVARPEPVVSERPLEKVLAAIADGRPGGGWPPRGGRLGPVTAVSPGSAP